MAIAEDIAQTLSDLGEETRVVTAKNVDDIIENARRVLSQTTLDTKKKAMSTPAVQEMQKRFLKNPTTGKLEGSKKKVVSSLEQEAKKYKSAEGFVKAQEAPKTVTVWNKSKFSNEGAYTERPVIRKVENKTMYQGGDDSRQFWTPDKKYAEQFGDVKEKTGTFYQIDNGNRMTEVYVDASKTKSQLIDIWNKANKK